jgi:hypothetical protein
LGQHGDSNIFPPLDGSAFYLNICRINHSCEPNVRVEYVNKGAYSAGGGGLTAQVRVRILFYHMFFTLFPCFVMSLSLSYPSIVA